MVRRAWNGPPRRAVSDKEDMPRMNRFYEDLIHQMEEEFDRSDDGFRRMLNAFLVPGRFWEPRADVYETRESVRVKIELAGVRPETIQVELHSDGRSLAVRGMRQDEHSEAMDRILFHQMEIYMGPFERVVPLPSGAELERDQVAAAYKEGFLIITLPKRDNPCPQVMQIRVDG